MAVPYYGDFAEDDTVLIPFNTFDSNDPSASVTVTDLADADIKVHKDGSVDEIATDGASVTINFDSITGNHLITINTSAHTDYTTGSEYAVRLEGITIDAATVNAWVGAFSIERAGGVLALLKAGTVKVDVETIKTQAITCGAAVTVRADVGAAAAPGAANGMFIGGTNAATTVASLSVTGQLDAGSVVVDAGMDIVGALSANSLLIDTTTTLTGNVSCAAAFDVVGALTAGSVSIDGTADVIGALTCASFGVDGAVTVGTTVGVAGATTLASLSVTGQLDAGTVLVDGTTTLTGAVSLGAALGVVGATTLASLVVSGTTALTGAVTMPAGLTANITGDITGTLSTVTTCTTNSDMVGTNGAALASAYTATRASYLDELAAANLPTDIAAIPTTAEIKTAMEAANGDLDVLVTALVNKMVITEANGATEQFDDTDTTLGSIAAAFATDGTYTTRKRLVQ